MVPDLKRKDYASGLAKCADAMIVSLTKKVGN
jgi:hypothetical protein